MKIFLLKNAKSKIKCRNEKLKKKYESVCAYMNHAK